MNSNRIQQVVKLRDLKIDFFKIQNDAPLLYEVVAMKRCGFDVESRQQLSYRSNLHQPIDTDFSSIFRNVRLVNLIYKAIEKKKVQKQFCFNSKEKMKT